MDRTGQQPIHGQVMGIGFRSPVSTDLPVDVHLRSDILARQPRQEMLRPQRLEFHLLYYVCRGRINHVVDFAALTLRGGDLVHIRPGQVQQWDLTSSARAWMVAFRPELIRDERWFPGCATAVQHFSGAARRDLESTMEELVTEQSRFAMVAASVPAMVALLHLLLARAERADPSSETDTGTAHGPRPLPEPYPTFRRLLGSNLGQLHRTDQYAALCGYSSRTLNRACQTATGHTAKELIDRRLMLEAQRLLVHTADSCVSIGNRLGFTDPSAFTRTFRRVTGSTPQRFRADHTHHLP